MFILAAHKFLKDGCALRASALTYYTLLSIVPVFAMAFGIAKGFGLQEVIRRRILEMAAQANWPEEIVLRILAFSDSMCLQARKEELSPEQVSFFSAGLL
jgi:membrane protein